MACHNWNPYSLLSACCSHANNQSFSIIWSQRTPTFDTTLLYLTHCRCQQYMHSWWHEAGWWRDAERRPSRSLLCEPLGYRLWWWFWFCGSKPRLQRTWISRGRYDIRPLTPQMHHLHIVVYVTSQSWAREGAILFCMVCKRSRLSVFNSLCSTITTAHIGMVWSAIMTGWVLVRKMTWRCTCVSVVAMRCHLW